METEVPETGVTYWMFSSLERFWHSYH